MCQCSQGKVQNEEDVLIECPLSLPVRRRFNNLNFSGIQNLLDEKILNTDLCGYIDEVLQIYKDIN